MKNQVTFFIFLSFLIILLSSAAFAQSQWKIFDQNNSPFSTNIFNSGAVGCDGVGNVWIGTDIGLYKYDGIFWNYYNTSNSGIPYNNISKIFIDRINNLWFLVGSSYPYFVKFDGTVWEEVDTNQNCYSSVSRHWVVDGYGTKWIFSNASTFIIRYDGFSCIGYDFEDIGVSCRVTQSAFMIDHNDNLWFAGEDGIYHPGGIARTSQNGWVVRVWNGIPFFGLAVDSNNKAWTTQPGNSSLYKLNYDNLETDTTYLIYDPGTPGYRYGENLRFDSNGNLWMVGMIADQGTDSLGLLFFNTSTEEWVLYEENNSLLPANEIGTFNIDVNNNKWIGTNNGLAAFNEDQLVLPTQLTTQDTLNFGNVLVDSTVTESITIFNTTSENLLIDSIDISSSEFAATVSLPVTIPAGDSLIISINFQPDSVEEHTVKLTLFTNKGMYIQVLNGNGVLTSDSNETEPITMDYYLEQNYPNPFNPITTIPFYIPETNKVNLIVYDVLGNKIFTLINEERSAGNYVFKFDATGLPSGIYFYRLRAGSFVKTKKMVLSK